MLSNELSTIALVLCLLTVSFCVAVYVWMLKLANFCRDAVAFVQNENKRAVSLRRITELDVAVTELTDSYNALYESNKKLRSRIGMRSVREKRSQAGNGVDSNPPADEAGRAAYKATLRNKLKQEGRL